MQSSGDGSSTLHASSKSYDTSIAVSKTDNLSTSMSSSSSTESSVNAGMGAGNTNGSSTVSASIGVSSSGESASTLSVSKYHPSGSSSYTSSQTGSTSSGSSTSYGSMEVAGVVGMENGAFSSSNSSSSKTEISASSNSRIGDQSSWSSSAVIASGGSGSSVSGAFNSLSGGDGSSASSGPELIWASGSSSNAKGTFVSGSLVSFNNGNGHSGFSSTARSRRVAIGAGSSIGNTNPSGSTSASYSAKVHDQSLSHLAIEPSDGSEKRTQSVVENDTSVLSMGASVSGGKFERTATFSVDGNRTLHLTIDPVDGDASSTTLQAGWGNSIQYAGGSGGELLTTSSFRGSKRTDIDDQTIGGWDKTKRTISDLKEFRQTISSSNGIRRFSSATQHTEAWSTERWADIKSDDSQDVDGIEPNFLGAKLISAHFVSNDSTVNTSKNYGLLTGSRSYDVRLERSGSSNLEMEYELTDVDTWGGAVLTSDSKNYRFIDKIHFSQGKFTLSGSTLTESSTCYAGDHALILDLDGGGCSTHSNYKSHGQIVSLDDDGNAQGKSAFSSRQDGDNSESGSYDPNQFQQRQGEDEDGDDGGKDGSLKDFLSIESSNLFAAGFAVGVTGGMNADVDRAKAITNQVAQAGIYWAYTSDADKVADAASLISKIRLAIKVMPLALKAGLQTAVSGGTDLLDVGLKAYNGNAAAINIVAGYAGEALKIANGIAAEVGGMSDFDKGRLTGLIAYELGKEALIEAGIFVGTVGTGTAASNGLRAFRFAAKGGGKVAGFVGEVIDKANKAIKLAKNASKGASSKFPNASGDDIPWQTPGSRVCARATSLTSELGLGANGYAKGLNVRKLAPHELLALSERYGIEFSLIENADGTFQLWSGTINGVGSDGGLSVVNRWHTHPGIGRKAATPSVVDCQTHLKHRNYGGKGGLNVISRLEDGGTFVKNMNYAQAKQFIEDMEEYMRLHLLTYLKIFGGGE